MALLALTCAAQSWARPPTLTRRELGSLAGAAGLAAASSGGLLLPASAGGIPAQKQPGFKLNTGQAFPTASFGLQVYDDATAQKLTSLALEVRHRTWSRLGRVGGTRQGYAPGHPHTPSFLSHTPTRAGGLP
jgi:hypothetical protein